MTEMNYIMDSGNVIINESKDKSLHSTISVLSKDNNIKGSAYSPRNDPKIIYRIPQSKSSPSPKLFTLKGKEVELNVQAEIFIP